MNRKNTLFILIIIILSLGIFLHFYQSRNIFRKTNVYSPSTSLIENIKNEVEESAYPFTSQGNSPFVEIAKKVVPAVVSVEAERVDVVESPFSDFFEDPFFKQFKKFFPEFENKREVKRPVLGSGFIVSEDGYILTNNHVIERAKKIIIKMENEKEYEAKVVGKDEMTDVALLKIDAKNLSYVKLGNSDEVEIGEWVMAVGNPFHLIGTVTVGVISAKGRSGLPIRGGGAQIQNFLQTDAAINPGNSGGPLVNIRGEVIGINCAIKTGSLVEGNIGIGFAIPINMAKKVMQDLIKYKEVKRGWFGVYYQPVTDELAQIYKLKEAKGVLVQKVIKNSPAYKAGIQEEDIILEWNNKKVKYSNFAALVTQTQIGEKVKVKIWRKGEEKILEIKVGERPKEEEIAEEENEWKEVGIKVTSSKEGVVITEVKPGSPAYNAGIRPDDIIKKIGDKEIKNIKDFNKAKKIYSKKDIILFKLKRGEVNIFVGIKIK